MHSGNRKWLINLVYFLLTISVLFSVTMISSCNTAGIPHLKEIYAESFDFGAAVPPPAFSNHELVRLMSQQFSILTPENELKPDFVLDVEECVRLTEKTGDETAVSVQFTSAGRLLKFGKKTVSRYMATQ